MCLGYECVSLRVTNVTLGNISGFHLVRPTVSRGGTQDTVISPSSLLLLLYIQIFRENPDRGIEKSFVEIPFCAKIPLIFSLYIYIFWIAFFFPIFGKSMIVKFRGSKDKGFLSRKIRVREFIIISNVLETCFDCD